MVSVMVCWSYFRLNDLMNGGFGASSAGRQVKIPGILVDCVVLSRPVSWRSGFGGESDPTGT